MRTDRGCNRNPTFGQPDYSVRHVIENDKFSDPPRITTATAHIQGIVQQDRQAVAQSDAKGKERALVANRLARAKHIDAFKSPSVGSVEFCESVMLLPPGYPVDSRTLFSCEKGKATLGGLRSYG